ncbi:MAG: hypothetical protein ACXAD7_24740 [Candidatus Kariarchaeaceae archaeon]|jgi:uncharacterized damage-inducible protein DinB
MASNLNLKSELISILEIADINLLMSIKSLQIEKWTKQIGSDINSILRIFIHCAKQMDKYLSKYTNKFHIKDSDIRKNFEESSSPRFFVEKYLLIYLDFIDNVKKTPEEDFNKPIGRGEKLVTIIQRLSLHFSGHMGQIYLIRRFLGEDMEEPYSFIRAMSAPSRKKLKKEWMEWWDDQK